MTFPSRPSITGAASAPSRNIGDARPVDSNAKVGVSLDSSRFCPNCSAQLKEHRCKLACPQCGFYLSCSDFHRGAALDLPSAREWFLGMAPAHG